MLIVWEIIQVNITEYMSFQVLKSYGAHGWNNSIARANE